MRNIACFIVVLALTGLMTPAAYAFEPDRDWAPSDPCGSIDPDRACYLPLGTKDCPPRTSYSSCVSRCDCQFEKNLKNCGTSPTCKSLATSEKNACYGACLADFS